MGCLREGEKSRMTLAFTLELLGKKFRFMHVTFKYVQCAGGYATRQLRASESGCVHEDVGEASRIQVGFPFTWVKGYLPPGWE